MTEPVFFAKRDLVLSKWDEFDDKTWVDFSVLREYDDSGEYVLGVNDMRMNLDEWIVLAQYILDLDVDKFIKEYGKSA